MDSQLNIFEDLLDMLKYQTVTLSKIPMADLLESMDIEIINIEYATIPAPPPGHAQKELLEVLELMEN